MLFLTFADNKERHQSYVLVSAYFSVVFRMDGHISGDVILALLTRGKGSFPTDKGNKIVSNIYKNGQCVKC